MRTLKHYPNDKGQKGKNSLPIAQWQDYLQQQLNTLKAFENDLIANQTKLFKCWFHVDIETLHSRLKGMMKQIRSFRIQLIGLLNSPWKI